MTERPLGELVTETIDGISVLAEIWPQSLVRIMIGTPPSAPTIKRSPLNTATRALLMKAKRGTLAAPVYISSTGIVSASLNDDARLIVTPDSIVKTILSTSVAA